MSASVTLRNIVREAEYLFLVRVVPLHRHLERDAFLLCDCMKRSAMQHVLAPIDVFDKPLHSSSVREVLLFSEALVYQLDLDPVVEKRKLAEPSREDVEMVLDHSEGLRAGQKMHLGAASLGLAGYLERRHRHTAPEFHKVALPVASNGKTQPLGEGIDHGHAHAVQATRDPVGVVVELSTRVKLGHHDLRRRALPFVVFVPLGGNAAAVSDYADRVVRVDRDCDLVTETC